MSLLEDAMETMVMLDKTHKPDGEGGFITSYAEGAEFSAGVTFDTSIEARVAEKQGVTSRYTVTTAKALVLEYHDVFKRRRDGKIFRVTSDGDDKQTPKSASFQIAQVTAEEWSLPV